MTYSNSLSYFLSFKSHALLQWILLLFVKLKFDLRNCRFYLEETNKWKICSSSLRSLKKWFVGSLGADSCLVCFRFPNILCFSKVWIRLCIVPVGWPWIATQGMPSAKAFLYSLLPLFQGSTASLWGLWDRGKCQEFWGVCLTCQTHLLCQLRLALPCKFMPPVSPLWFIMPCIKSAEARMSQRQDLRSWPSQDLCSMFCLIWSLFTMRHDFWTTGLSLWVVVCPLGVYRGRGRVIILCTPVVRSLKAGCFCNGCKNLTISLVERWAALYPEGLCCLPSILLWCGSVLEAGPSFRNTHGPQKPPTSPWSNNLFHFRRNATDTQSHSH